MENTNHTPEKEEAKDTLKDVPKDSSKVEPSSITPENQKGIDLHNKAARHYEDAAKLHHEAAKFHEKNDHKMAGECTEKANAEATLGNDAAREDALFHALNR
jgi:hypothetical protein